MLLRYILELKNLKHPNRLKPFYDHSYQANVVSMAFVWIKFEPEKDAKSFSNSIFMLQIISEDKKRIAQLSNGRRLKYLFFCELFLYGTHLRVQKYLKLICYPDNYLKQI